MKITIKKLLLELNKDLEWEYAAAIQYVQHATTINGSQFDSIQKELLIHRRRRCSMLSCFPSRINFLGGVPSVEVEGSARNFVG